MSTSYKSPEQVGLLHSNHPDIIESSVEVYQDLASVYWDTPGITADNIYRQIVCGDASALMLKSLGRRGYHTWQRTAKAIRTIKDNWAEFTEIQDHDYLIALARRGIMVIDPTWKQFLDEDDPSYPNVLVGTRSEVLEIVQKAGVVDHLHELWRPLDPSTGIMPPFEF